MAVDSVSASTNGVSTTSQPFIPIFNGDKYEFWSTRMKTFFRSQDLWDLVEDGFADPDTNQQRLKENKKRDAKALFFLQQAVHDNIFSRITYASTSKKAWQILKIEFHQDSNKAHEDKMNQFQEKKEPELAGLELSTFSGNGLQMPHSSPSTANTIISSPANSLSCSSTETPPRTVRSLIEIYESCNCTLYVSNRKSYVDADKEQVWENTMNEDMSCIKKNDTWELVDLPEDWLDVCSFEARDCVD